MTCWSLGVSCFENSSCLPAATWELRIVERYTLIVEANMPSVAKCAVNSSKVSSDAGNIDMLAILQNVWYLLNPALYTFQVEGDTPR